MPSACPGGGSSLGVDVALRGYQVDGALRVEMEIGILSHPKNPRIMVGKTCILSAQEQLHFFSAAAGWNISWGFYLVKGIVYWWQCKGSWMRIVGRRAGKIFGLDLLDTRVIFRVKCRLTLNPIRGHQVSFGKPNMSGSWDLFFKKKNLIKIRSRVQLR